MTLGSGKTIEEYARRLSEKIGRPVRVKKPEEGKTTLVFVGEPRGDGGDERHDQPDGHTGEERGNDRG